MKKKFIFLAVFGTYLTFILFAPAIIAFPTNMEIEVDDEDIDEPINPSESKDILVKIKFRVGMSSISKMLFLNRRIGRIYTLGVIYFFKFLRPTPKANISFTVDNPTWCQVDSDTDSVELDIDNVDKEATLKFTITLDKDAPALVKDQITINANYPGIRNIEPVSNSTNISFMPAYVSNISVESMKNYTITPKKEVMIPVNITNNGNGQSMITVSGFDKDNWNITPDLDNIVNIGETKQIMIKIIPPKNFDNETINFTFESKSTAKNVSESYLQGESVDLSITFFDDGSLDEEDDFIDVTSIIIIAFVLIIILIILYLVFRKKE
jgi:hypothetical protein